MNSADEEPLLTEAEPGNRQVFHALLDLARQYKPQFIVVALFSFLYTGLDLLQPLIYKQAINAVAGLFVNQVPGAAAATGIAARTPEETFHTLMVSVIALFFIAVSSYFFYQRADYYGAKVASYMESRLIVDTFGHVLRLPIRFFAHQGSAGL